MQTNCGDDFHKFCLGVEHDVEAIKRCLLSNKEKLSEKFKAIFPELKTRASGMPKPIALPVAERRGQFPSAK